MKTLVLCCMMLAVCFTQTCMFTTGLTSGPECLAPSSGECGLCGNGYGFFNGACYPPCPSGWTELMPGYCINSTIIAKHQNFTLCPTNQTMEMTAGAGQFLCVNYNTGGCQCAPACPSGYSSIGCECIYGNSMAEIGHQHSWLYIFSAIGLFTILLGAGYLVKKYMLNSQVKIPLQSQANIDSKYVSIVESK